MRRGGWPEMDQALAVLIIAMVTLWVVLGIAEQPPESSTVHCYSGTERLVSEEGEYPVFELECDGAVRVLVLD